MSASHHQLSDWFVKAAEKVGSPRRRYFVINGNLIDYFEKERNGQGINKKGSIELSSGTLVSAEGRELQIRTPSRVYILNADTAAISIDWKNALLSVIARLASTLQASPLAGWLVKAPDGVGQPRRRYFVCDGAWVNYYDAEDMATAKMKGKIKISALTHVVADGNEVRVVNPERTWVLTAEDVISAARWASILQDIQAGEEGLKGRKASKVDGDSDPNGDEPGEDRFVMPGRGVWLWKDGTGLGSALRGARRRYFTLLYGSDVNTMKFAYFTDFVDQHPVGMRGFVPITRTSVIADSEDTLTIVCT